jgi:hypothetical protein
MVRLTLIARASDGLPLAEGLESDKDPDIEGYKAQAKVCVLVCVLCAHGAQRGGGGSAACAR